MKPIISITQDFSFPYNKLQTILFACCLIIQLNSLFAKKTIPSFTDKNIIKSTTTCACDPVSDSLALVAFYNSTNGDNWYNNTNWLVPGQPISTWVGLDTNTEGCVSRLELYGNALSGTIPPVLGNLSCLSELWLSDNSLSGSIPPQLGNLNCLTFILMYNNFLSGAIPAELGNLTNLISLNLHNNSLSGAIPAELGNLNNLISIYLHENQLSGCFPEELNINCGINYSFLNNTALPWQGNFQNFCNGLAQIGASCDDGDPNTPNDIIQADCSCSGTNLNTCSYLDSLVLVELYNATDGANWTTTWNLSAPMSSWYGVTTNAEGCVTCLDLDEVHDCTHSSTPGNNLVGTIPDALGSLTNLTFLNLRSNNLSGTIPIELGNLTEVTYLNLSYNNLTGSIPSELGQLNNLVHLSLNFNSLSGNIPSELGQLENLLYLHLYDNSLSGNIPPELGNLSNLFELHFGNNSLSGPIPSEIGQLSNLGFLNLFSNALSGSIPPELGNLTNLMHLWLHDNQLSGCFPQELDVHCNITYSYRFYNNPGLPGGGDFDAFCANGTGSCSAPLCEFPQNINPVVISGNVARVEWDAVANAERYRIRYRTIGSAWTELLTAGTENFRFINALNINTDYEVQVKSLCDTENSTWSASQFFTTLSDQCDLPSNPWVNNITNVEAQPNWIPSPDDIKYKFKYRPSAGGAWTEVITNNTFYKIYNLAPATFYRFKLKTKCTLGWTNWSSKYLFLTLSPSAARLLKNNNLEKPINNIILYPNPVQDILSIELGGEQVETISILSFEGKQIRQLPINSKTIHTDVAELPDGIYCLKIVMANGTLNNLKFIKH